MQTVYLSATFAMSLELRVSKDRKAHEREVSIALPALKPVKHLSYAGLPENRQLKETVIRNLLKKLLLILYIA